MRRFLLLLGFALLSASAWGQNIFNCSSGFVGNTAGTCSVSYVGYGGLQFAFMGNTSPSQTVSGTTAILAPTGSTHVGSGLIYQTAVNVQAFTSTFTFVPDGWYGPVFTLNNNTNGNAGGQGPTFAAGAGCEAGFYQGFDSATPPWPNKVFAIMLDQQTGLTGGSFTYSSTQMYQQGQSPCNPNDTQPDWYPTNKISTYPVPLNSPAGSGGTTTGDTYSTTIVYTGTNVTQTMYDVTAGGTCTPVTSSTCFSHIWNNVSVPSLVGSTTAYVGITAGTNGASSYPLDIDAFSYTVLSFAAMPSCTPGSGTYGSTQSVTCSDSSSGSIICYNLTGTPYTDGNGNCPNGTKVTGAISVAAGQSIFVVAGSGSSAYGDSPVASYIYQIGSATAQPTFSLATASYNGTQAAYISGATAGSAIYYATDGSTPTASSTLYTGPVTVSSSLTLKAIAVASGTPSAVSSTSVTINPFAGQAPANAPTFSLAPGTYSGTQSVTLSSSTSGSNICYVLASSPPTLLPQTDNKGGCLVGTPYTGAISVSSTQTIYAMAGTTLTGPPSSLVQGTFTISGSGGGTPSLAVNAISNQTYGAAPLTVSATSNSPGAITYSVVSGPATISGSTVTITGVGSVTLQASQAASGSYTTATATTSFTVSAAAPTLGFTAISSQTYPVTPFTAATTSNSTGAITYSVVSGPATISGSTVTITGVGTVTLQAIQAATTNYTTATVTTSFSVAGETPNFNFAAIPNQTYGVAPFTVSATSNSPGAISYTGSSGPASLSGNVVTITGIGTVTLIANQAASGIYAAGLATISFSVAAAAPTLSFAAIASQTFGVAPFAVSATSNSTGTIAYSVVSGPATISGSTVTITGAGTVTLRASQAAAGNYVAATATTSFNVSGTASTLAFAAIASQTYGVTPFAVSASSPSTGAITYSVLSGPATISGNTVTITGAGTVTLQASQAAAGSYAAATTTTSFSVTAALPTLSFTAVPNQTYGAASFAVSATSNSTGAITYSVVGGPATISGSTVTITGVGSVKLLASQAATTNYTSNSVITTFNVNAATPTLAFATIPNQTYGVAPFGVSASSASTGVITYSVVSGPATISGSMATLTGTGTVTLQASQAAAGNYAAATITTSFSVNSGASTLNFASIPNQTYGVAPFAVSATSSSTGAITYSVIGGPATISGNAVTVTGVGTVTLQASQAAAGSYPAASATTSFNVIAATPILTFAAIPNQVYGASPFAVSATSNSTGAITYSVIGGPAIISGNTLTLTGSGTVTLQATQAAGGNYAAATVTTSFNVSGATPTMSFAAIPNKTYGVAPFAVSATSISTGAITYSVISGPAIISGNTVTVTGVGAVTLQASQAAAGGYAAATATTSFNVIAATPTLTFAAIPNQTYGVAPFAVSATSNSTGTITYSVVSGSATVSGNTVALTGTGTVTLQASQAAAGNYAAATVTTSFSVNSGASTLNFAAIPNQTYGVAPFAVSATSSSTGAITYSVLGGPATISGNTVTITGVGTVTLQASQAAAGSYAAATANTSFNVIAVTPTLTFAAIPNQTYGVAPFAVSATSNSTGTITYSVLAGPATVSGNTVILAGTGTVTLQASQAAAGGYTATTATTSFNVNGGTSTLTFIPVQGRPYGVSPFTVSAISNSTGTITYSVISGPATISGNTVTLTGVGTVILQASQAAAGGYAAATATTSFNVMSVSPTLTFTAIPNQIYGTPPFAVVATSNSPGATTYSVVSGPATISGNMVTLTGAGTVILEANQAAAGDYSAATVVTKVISTSSSAWLGDGNGSLSTFDLAGDAVGGSSGFTGGGVGTIASPLGLAVDSSGNVWVANSNGVSEFSRQGVAMTSAAYTGAGITSPQAVAVDGAGQIWAANSNGTVSVLSNNGTAVSPSTGYSGSGSTPAGIAIDISGSVWIPSSAANTVTKILGATTPVVVLASGSATGQGVKP